MTDADHAAGVPPGRPAVLGPLAALVGEWETEAFFDAGFFGPGAPAVTGRGHTSFEWMDGEFFLLQRFTAEHPAAPNGLAVIGAEDGQVLTQHYYDSRGVERVYQMSLDGGVWRLQRDAPGFCQRFTGTLASDSATIEGAWEMSPDGSDWKHDFRLTYRKLR
jgi:hypothetical protein